MAAPTTSHKLLIEQPCKCDVCKDLKKQAFALASTAEIAEYEDAKTARAMYNIKDKIDALRKDLHRKHRAELYEADAMEGPRSPCASASSRSLSDASCSRENPKDHQIVGNGGSQGAGHSEEGSDSGFSNEMGAIDASFSDVSEDDVTAHTPTCLTEDIGTLSAEPQTDKFMVCDHCRGHGLPCNEAPVCQQCQMSSTPCVHRRCTISPNSFQKCSRYECRYAHKDHLPVPDKAYYRSDYLILPGKLRDYLAGGEVLRLDWEDVDIDDIDSFDADARQRQKDARQDSQSWVRQGNGTLEDWEHDCGQYCGKTRVIGVDKDGDRNDRERGGSDGPTLDGMQSLGSFFC